MSLSEVTMREVARLDHYGTAGSDGSHKRDENAMPGVVLCSQHVNDHRLQK